MCKFKSALVLKDRVFVPDYDSHDQMLKELKIPDDFSHASKVFVRVELSPADGNPASDPMGWRIKIDQDILPDWFVHEVDEQRVKVAITEWCKVHVLRDGIHVVHDGRWITTSSATVKAFDSATVEAFGSATVDAFDSATVEAFGSATVDAFGSATVKAFDSATVKAFDSATVEAFDSATVEAFDSATVKATSSATVKAFDSATVEASGSATVKASGSATVKAFGSATVILPKRWQTQKPVELNDEAICINHRTHTIKSAIKWTQEG